eukprot:CAMPEP_0167759646 /NCGR_PEP_ID=MMETSP0110_2-20121227/11137_1 /TAXON_ID=629695 /ORGANISM="Gymnochlora sp., Strain CCMP2014" /LENGTH=1045 /DNA_ID=CAMNT_0007646051 /DNA_START=59 /DNA_END=3196 /DNA_ORIENTATION=-
MPVLVLTIPKAVTLEALTCVLAAAKSEAVITFRQVAGKRLNLLIDGFPVYDPIAICRAILASAPKSKMVQKKAPKLVVIDSLMEMMLDGFEAIRKYKSDGESEGYLTMLKVLDTVAKKVTKGLNGIAGTREPSLADMFILSGSFAVFGDEKEQKESKTYPSISEWFKNQLATEKWFRQTLTSVNVAHPSDLSYTESKKTVPQATANKAVSSKGTKTAATKAKKLEADIMWKPVVPYGHTAYSWPKRKRSTANKKKASKASQVPVTREVPSPAEWKSYKTEKKIRLPIKGKKNILITSALPYVNNVPHLGNIIGCVLSADVYSRYCRLRGYNSIYVCGTDEYGTTTEMKALLEKLTPRQICDKYHKIHKEIYEWFNIDFDHFGRTTTPQQTEIAQSIYKSAKKNGYVLEKTTQQLYDPEIKKFLADRYVVGICPKCGFEEARGDQCDRCGSIDYSTTDLKNPKSKLSNATPVIKDSKHLYLDLPKLSKDLDNFVEKSKKDGLWTENAKRVTYSWIHQRGLLPRCITRDLEWGTPVPEPGYEDKVFYVWFDAPIGYISITANYTKDWEKWWRSEDVKLVQFMGKDNIPFHTVIFPSTLLAARDEEKKKKDYILLDTINVCEYLQYEGGLKFSKSRGTGVFGNHAKDTGIPPAVWRYYLLSVRPENADTDFNWDDLVARNNGELISNLGNFVNRIINFASTRIGGVVSPAERTPADEKFFAAVEGEVNKYISLMENVNLRDALRTVLEVSRLGNGYIQSSEPWKLIKEGEFDRAKAIISNGINIVWLLAALCQPYMPSISLEICKQLRVPPQTLFIPGKTENGSFKCSFGPPAPSWKEAKSRGGLFVGHKIGKPSPLFTELDKKKIEVFRKRYGGQGAASSEAKQISFPFNLIIGRVTEATAHPSADHLAVIKLEFGPGRASIQLVSGIRKSYPDLKALEKQHVLVVENIKASKFKGVKTQGLLLCADTKTGKKAITVPGEAVIGSKLVPEGAVTAKKKFDPKKFSKFPMKVNATGQITYAGRTIKSGSKGYTFPKLGGDYFSSKVAI